MKKDITWKRFFQSKLFFIVGIGLLILLSINLTRAQLKDRAIRREIINLETEVTELEEERIAQESLLALLETSKYLEKEARRLLGYTKPGEQVVVIDRQEQVDEQDKKSMSNPQKWWIYFFGSAP